MTDFATLRQRMVDNQIRTGGVTSLPIIAAFSATPREIFVDEAELPFAYADRELRLPGAKTDRRLMPAVQLARLIQTLPFGPNAKVMVVGCGSGYSTAILARLTRRVIAVEEDERLAALAEQILRELGVTDATVVRAKLTEGYPAEAPYDALLVDGAVEFVPEALISQLAPEGALAVIERDDRVSRAMLYERVGARHAKWPQFDAWAALLPGFAKKREFIF